MRVLCGVVVFSVLLTLPVQASAQEITKEESAKINAEVMEWADAWIETWEMNDCEIANGFWHPDVIFQPRAGVLAETLDDVKEQCNQALANRASFSGNVVETKIKVLSQDAAVLAITWEGTFHYRDETPPRYYAHSTTVHLLLRTEDGWGISFYVNSNDPAQAVGGEG